MTTNNEFKARALYDFVAEGPSELSLTAGEIITITSGETGNDWWYALNASGQLGAIPATYVEIINDPIRPVSVDAESTSDNNSTYRMSLGANYQPRLEEERQQSVTSTNQRTQTPDHEYNTDSSFDSSSSRRGSQNLLETPIRSTSQTNNNNMNEFDPITSYGQTQEQHGDLTSSIPVTKSDQGYDTSSPLLVSIASNETTPVVSTSPPTKTDVLTDNTTKSNNENTASSSTTKTKTEKSKLFTLKRSKHKPDAEKRRMSTDNSLEASKDDSDSDALSDSGSPHNTNIESSKSIFVLTYY